MAVFPGEQGKPELLLLLPLLCRCRCCLPPICHPAVWLTCGLPCSLYPPPCRRFYKTVHVKDVRDQASALLAPIVCTVPPATACPPACCTPSCLLMLVSILLLLHCRADIK